MLGSKSEQVEEDCDKGLFLVGRKLIVVARVIDRSEWGRCRLLVEKLCWWDGGNGDG